jgi:hypothetical protein
MYQYVVEDTIWLGSGWDIEKLALRYCMDRYKCGYLWRHASLLAARMGVLSVRRR